jgi:hypothetical protein
MTSELRDVFIERLSMKAGVTEANSLASNSWRLKLAIRKSQCLPIPDITSELRDIFIRNTFDENAQRQG